MKYCNRVGKAFPSFPTDVSQMSHKAYFNGESFLGSAAKISPFEDFEGGFDFRTLQPSGLLFYHSSEVRPPGSVMRRSAVQIP